MPTSILTFRTSLAISISWAYLLLKKDTSSLPVQNLDEVLVMHTSDAKAFIASHGVVCLSDIHGYELLRSCVYESQVKA